jgi:hypothetical protein
MAAHSGRSGHDYATMAESEDNFVSRWSRRKRETRDDAHDEATSRAKVPLAGEESASPAQAGGISEPGAAPVRVEDLPDPDTLTEEADFTVFMNEGVPETLRRRALRRLWRLNPLYANLDGLNDYDLDYTDAATVVAGLKTLYKVGRGIARPDEDSPLAAKDEAGSDETPVLPEAPEDPGPADEEAAVARDDDNPEDAAPSADSAGSENAFTPDLLPNRDDSRPENLRRRGARLRRWGDS